MPEGAAATALAERAALIERYECVLPAEAIAREAGKVGALRRLLGRPVLVSPIATSAAEKKIGSRIELFVSHGYRPDQVGAVEELLATTQPGDLDHLVVRIGLADDSLAVADALSTWQARTGCRLDIHLRLAADNPATNVVDDALILRGVAVFHLAALAHPDLTFVLDTFMDVDRGYFVRHGLIDRRCNLRPAGLAVEALSAHLGSVAQVANTGTAAGRTLACRCPDRSALVLLPEDGATLAVEPGALSALGLCDDALTVPLDAPWTIDPGIGLALSGAGPVPRSVTRPTLIVGGPEGGTRSMN